MYSYRTLILFPKTDDYSSIHEWSFTKALNAHTNCTLQPYRTNDELGGMIHHLATDDTTRMIILFGADEQWHFLNTTLAHHPNCAITPSPAPYHFYARMNAHTHLMGLSNEEEQLKLAHASLTAYFHALEPHTLESLSSQVGTTLKQVGLAIACAESCTGGLIAKTLTDIAGASNYVRGGVCTYTAEAKTTILHVPETIIHEQGIVSQATAEAMATGAQQLFAADIALSTTGVAGPGADTDGNPEGLVYCCIAIKNERHTYRYLASDVTLCIDRAFIRADCVRFLLEKLLMLLSR